MINVYFSTTDSSDKVQNEIIEQLGNIDTVCIRSYENEKAIVCHDDVYPTIICTTPHTYNKYFLDQALKAMADNPKKFVFLDIKCEYNNLDHLVGYKNDEISFINLIKLACSYEDEKFYESIFAIKSAFHKIKNA